MIINEKTFGYRFSFEECDEDDLILNYWELRKIAKKRDEAYLQYLFANKTPDNFKETTFLDSDLKRKIKLTKEEVESFALDCDYARNKYHHYDMEQMVECLYNSNPTTLENFPYKTFPVTKTTIKNDYIEESFITRKYEGITEELPQSHYAWKYVDAIKKNPFFQDEAYEQNFDMVCDGEDWYVSLKCTSPNSEFTHLLVSSKKAEEYLEKYKDIDYSKVRNKTKEKEDEIEAPSEEDEKDEKEDDNGFDL